MRIGQLAAAADTTPRTVRHYHRLGLLAEPDRRSNGYREYTMSDVVRLIRVRWLADSGVPLGSIGAILSREPSADDTADTVADLEALVHAARVDHAKAARRLEKLTSMLADVESGRPISALPGDVAEILDEVIATAATPSVRAAFERERDLLEVLAISGNAPEQVFSSYAEAIADEDQRRQYVGLMEAWSSLAGRQPESVDTEIESLARNLVAQFERSGVDLSTQSEQSNGDVQFGLEDIVPDPAQREVILRVQRALFDTEGETR